MEEAPYPPPATSTSPPTRKTMTSAEDLVRVRRRNLETVLEQCQRTLELLKNADQNSDPKSEQEEKVMGPTSSPQSADNESDELNELLKSKVESPDFLDKIGSIHMSIMHNISDDSASWDMVSAKDLWEDEHIGAESEPNQDGYVLVSQDDIVEGIACFMAAYLLSLKETKDLTPNQLQDALSKTFSVKKSSTKLQKAWDGSKVIYNVASWGATAVGLYQNPALFRAASVAFWSSCHVLSKFF